MRVDAHQHFWVRSNGYYDWLTPDLAAIYRDFDPQDLVPFLDQANVDSTVLVQAAPNPAETEYLLSLADQHTFIGAVVGWVDMETEAGRTDLARFVRHPAFRGIRPMVQDLNDPNWLLRRALEATVQQLIEGQLVFEALIRPAQWEALTEFVRRYPSLNIIIDHAAKPNISAPSEEAGGFAEWANLIETMASSKNVTCKLSGLLTEAREGAGLPDIAPYLDQLLDCFGSDRLMWGSDWPVLGLSADYQIWLGMVEEWLDGKPREIGPKVLGANAMRTYRLSALPVTKSEATRRKA